MHKISWLINKHLLSIFFLILGILSFFYNYLFFVFILIFIIFYHKKCSFIISLAYLLGFILATRQSIKEKVIQQIASRNAIIDAQIKNITKVNSNKVDLQKIKINEKIRPKFIPAYFYTKCKKLKIGNIIKFSINKDFKFWQNNVSIKKDSESANLFSISNCLKEEFDKSVSLDTKKTCDSIFWGYNITPTVNELYCLDKLGCQHLMARSGLHLAPINAIFFLSQNKISTLLGIIILIFYALLSASSYSFWRAIIITILFYIWQLLGLKINKKLIFSQSLIITTILWPQAIFTASYQLSFGLVAALYFLVFQSSEINSNKRLKQ
jgi:ComEC/Rec2-related protein